MCGNRARRVPCKWLARWGWRLLRVILLRATGLVRQTRQSKLLLSGRLPRRKRVIRSFYPLADIQTGAMQKSCVTCHVVVASHYG